jgi:hypothetical protein
MAERRLSNPCLFCLNKASCYFSNHNIQNSSAALDRSHMHKACDLHFHSLQIIIGSPHPMATSIQCSKPNRLEAGRRKRRTGLHEGKLIVSNIKIISNFLLKPHRQLGLDQQSL